MTSSLGRYLTMHIAEVKEWYVPESGRQATGEDPKV